MANEGRGGANPWSQAQLHNAQVIIDVGNRLGMSNRDIQIALMTAMQESSLQNLNYGDRDSLGLFQQRASWGTAAQRTNPVWSATAFYSALKQVGNRQEMSLTQAAQAVQRSAYPDAYAKWAGAAATLLGRGNPSNPLKSYQDFIQPTIDESALTAQVDSLQQKQATGPNAPVEPKIAATQTSSGTPGVGAADVPMDLSDLLPTLDLTPTTDTPGDSAGMAGVRNMQTSAWRKRVVQLAEQQLGTPYVWGGEQPGRGFDCSGLVQYVYKQLGIQLPRVSYQQARSGHKLGYNQLLPGDLVAWDYDHSPEGADHIGIYIGNGRYIEAPHTGTTVRISRLTPQNFGWGVRMSA